MTAWLDMSQYPEVDPDAVLTADESQLLRTLLTQPVPDVPDEVWRRMLDVTWTTVEGDVVEGDVDLDDPAVQEHDEFGSLDDTGSVVTEWGGSHIPGAVHDGDHFDDAPDDASDDS